jgi:hypothetical protein
MERALYIQPTFVSTLPIQCASAGLPFVMRRAVTRLIDVPLKLQGKRVLPYRLTGDYLARNR